MKKHNNTLQSDQFNLSCLLLSQRLRQLELAAELRRYLYTSYVLAYDTDMSTLTASEARANLYRLIDEAAESHVPIRITGKRNNAVLVSEKDWASVQETMYLLSIPGMRESIREGMEASSEECIEELDW